MSEYSVTTPWKTYLEGELPIREYFASVLDPPVLYLKLSFCRYQTDSAFQSL